MSERVEAPLRILLVDDDDLNVELFTDVLTAAGHDVTVARDGPFGLSRALTERFDVVILDIQLPGKSGDEVCRELRAKGRKGPIIALSALALPDQIERGMAAGFDAYLTKPVSAEELRSAVRRYAEKSIAT